MRDEVESAPRPQGRRRRRANPSLLVALVTAVVLAGACGSESEEPIAAVGSEPTAVVTPSPTPSPTTQIESDGPTEDTEEPSDQLLVNGEWIGAIPPLTCQAADSESLVDPTELAPAMIEEALRAGIERDGLPDHGYALAVDESNGTRTVFTWSSPPELDVDLDDDVEIVVYLTNHGDAADAWVVSRVTRCTSTFE